MGSGSGGANIKHMGHVIFAEGHTEFKNEIISQAQIYSVTCLTYLYLQ